MSRALPSCLPVLFTLALAATPLVAQVPGAYPRLVASDDRGTSVPGPGGPFDNSGVFVAETGTALTLEVSYAPFGTNDAVAWGLLVSLQPTPFPTTQVPPPLFTLPPFIFLVPTPPILDGSGRGIAPIAIPDGLYEGTTYVQGLVWDVTNVPNLQLSNGIALQVVPPGFNVAFSFAREVPNTGIEDLDGVGQATIDADTLNTHFPLGSSAPPQATPVDSGLPASGFRFLPIVPNLPDAPVNPMARPVTRINAVIEATGNVFEVEDTSFFAPSGTLYVERLGSDLWRNKGQNGTSPPDCEVVTYRGKTATSFTGVSRRRLGSTGEEEYPHTVGDVVLGEYTFATSMFAQARSRICLDATNGELPHVVIPAYTIEGGPEGQEVELDLDLYLYEDVMTGEQGFAVLNRVDHTWRPIPGTLIDTSDERFWDPMISVAPDGRSFLACVRTTTGEFFPNDPDLLYAIRLDGRNWPSSGAQTWQVTFELADPPTEDDLWVRSREIYMPSVTHVKALGADEWVAYVGLKYKFKRTEDGDSRVGTTVNNLGNQVAPWLGWEGFWVREEVLVKDLIEVPLLPPGSTKPPPALPRSWITTDFGLTGSSDVVQRFDPTPLPNADNTALLWTGGWSNRIEDVFVIRNVEIDDQGQVNRVIINVSGYGFEGGQNTETGLIRSFDPGGREGVGDRAAISPSGNVAAWCKEQLLQEEEADWIQIARLDGTSFAQVTNVLDEGEGGAQQFRFPGPYGGDRAVGSMLFLDDDRLLYLMGQNPYDDPTNQGGTDLPRFDLFLYTISTDTMENISNTGGSLSGFDELGLIRPAATWLSEDGAFLYILRDGRISNGSTVLPAGTDIVNVIGVDLASLTLRDLTGDEFSSSALIGNLDISEDDCLSPFETPAIMQFTLGSGVQEGMTYFTARRPLDPDSRSELYVFDADDPFVAFQVTSNSPEGARITNVSPNPYGGKVAFARTADDQVLAASQHPFVVDLDNFLFERDLFPTLQSGGVPIGRVMDGSFHYLPPDPENGAGDALLLSFGSQATSSGIALFTAPLYYPLANVSNTLNEPTPLLLPVLSTLGLNPNWKIFLSSASLASGSAGSE